MERPSLPPSSLFSLARSKLLSVASGSGTRDSSNLHRWVLIKNSIVRSHPSIPDAMEVRADDCTYVPEPPEDEDEEEEDSFLFPNLMDHSNDSAEAQWLDSLLETLGDGDEPELDVDVQVSVLSVDDDDDDMEIQLSPFGSPSSSSDDLVDQAYAPPPPVAISTVSYPPLPYQPLWHPPLLCPFDYFAADVEDVAVAPPYLDALPFTYPDALDELEDLAVPDAIEDLSDDESDAPPTPWDRSSSSLALPPVDPVMVPLPDDERVRRRRPVVGVFVDMDTAFLNPFELDPLPFADEPRTFDRSLYQEC